MLTASPTRKLPSDDVLREHVASGMGKREIAEAYGVTTEAVRQRFVKAGIGAVRERPTHAHYLPWRLRADHVGDVFARRLRAYSKREQGIQLSTAEARLLDQWLVYMDGANPIGVPLSVHYDRNDDDGFWLEPRQPGDRDYISPPEGEK